MDENASKLLQALKDFPFWLLVGLSIATNISLFAPAIAAEMTAVYRPWLIGGAVLFSVLAVTRAVGLILQWSSLRKAAAEGRRTFHISPIEQQSHWSVSRQSDGSSTTQIAASLFVKNRRQNSLYLVKANLIKPKIKGKVIQNLIFIQGPGGQDVGSALYSGYSVPADQSLPVQVVIHILGCPATKVTDDLDAILALVDDDGNEQRIRMALKGFR